jgi:dihydrodipicolinate synthase/N-acetylneuraminate lyase
MVMFRGVGVALLTFFGADGERLEATATAEHAARLVDLGITAVIVAGSTGEAAALSPNERVELVRRIRGAVPARVPVVAGVGAPATRDAVRLTRDAAAAGADAFIALSPPGVADPRPYYESLATAAGELPLFAYHFPRTSPPGIAVDVLKELPVAGVKDSSGDAERLLATVAGFRGDVYTGSSALLTHASAIGCAGAILALANIEPQLCVQAWAGDGSAQRGLTDAHFAAQVRFPAGLKEMAAARFGTPSATRIGGAA